MGFVGIQLHVAVPAYVHTPLCTYGAQGVLV